MKLSLMPPLRRTLATIRLTPSATETAVSALATRRPSRYRRATVTAVIGARRHSCGFPPVIGAVDPGEIDDLIARVERRGLVGDDEQGLPVLSADGQEFPQHLPRGLGVEAGARLI